MAFAYYAGLKSLRMQDVIDACDANAANAYLEIGTTAMGTVLATVPLQDPSFTESGAVITLAGVPRSDTSADATGTAAEARLVDGGANNIVTGLTVGTGGGNNIVLDSVDITAGQTVTINTGTITHG
jgi:hypothetical protein